MSTYTDASLIVTPNGKKAGKLYSLKPTDGTGDLDVVRETTATYVDADGVIQTALANEPRFDYSNGSCPSILVEPQRTNLVLQSNSFDNVVWLKQSVSILNSNSLSPTGETNAFEINANGFDVINQLVNSTSNANFTYSVFLKYVDVQWLRVAIWSSIGGANQIRCWVDLQNGVLGNINTVLNANVINATITSFTDGWYKVTITGNFTDTATTYCPTITTASANNSTTRISGNYKIYGVQLEQGSNATSYIPTTTTSVTRNADVISKSGLTGITTITETFEDDTTNVISGSPTSYTMSQGRIKHVIGL